MTLRFFEYFWEVSGQIFIGFYTFILKGHRSTSGFGTVQGKIDLVPAVNVLKYPLIKVAPPSLYTYLLPYFPYIPIITEDDWAGYIVT